MASRNRPKLNNMKKRSKHSYDHRGQTGKFGTIFVENPPMWSCAPGPHELVIIPYDTMSGQNSEYRKGNSDLNMPFSNEELESGSTWDYKLSVLLHYSMGINEDTVLCLRTIGRRCPICEERERLLREEGLDINSSDIQALTARKRVLYNIVCFDSAEEFDKGIQVWDAPHASIEDELSILVNKRDIRTGEIINRPYFIPEEGWNILFERTGKGLNTEYKYLEIKKRLEKDDFTDSELDELYDSVFNFEDIIEVKEYDVLYEMLWVADRWNYVPTPSQNWTFTPVPTATPTPGPGTPTAVPSTPTPFPELQRVTQNQFGYPSFENEIVCAIPISMSVTSNDSNDT